MPRLAPSVHTPRFTRGDVLATIDPDTWINSGYRTLFYRWMWAAFAALAACARITPSRATTFTLAQYDTDQLRAATTCGHSYPVLLLPVVVAAIERYLKLRRKLGGTALFVSEDGSPLDNSTGRYAFQHLAAQYGLHGGQILARLYGFFDRCFVEETDRAAIMALRHRRTANDLDVPMSEIVAARDDHERLWKVLNRRHKLAGEAGRWIGGHGKAKIAREMRLFKPVRSKTPITNFMRTDPVCASLLRQAWTGRKLNAQRAMLIEEHLPYLSLLRDRGLLTTRQIAYLLNCTADSIRLRLFARRRAAETPAEREERERLERFWDVRILELYRERTDGETPGAFFERVRKPDPSYPFDRLRLLRTLQKGGVAPAQLAAKSGKRPRAKTAKSRKNESDGGGKRTVSAAT